MRRTEAARGSAAPNRSIKPTGHSSNVAHSIGALQHRMGNQALLRLLGGQTRRPDERDVRAGEDLHQVLSKAMQGGTSKLKIGIPGDRHEREADRAAEGATLSRPGAALSNNSAGGGEKLSRNERSHFERRFKHDFSRVRLHTDAKAARMAQALNAEAFTVGRDIYFDAGKRRAGTRDADRLLTHELAHVAQQSRTGPALQPKLVLTGTTDLIDRVLVILNSAFGGFYHCSVDAKSGEMKIEPVRAVHASSITGPTTRQSFLEAHLRSMISEAGTTTVGVVAGGIPVVGSYGLSQIDIADIEKLGMDQPGWDSRAALLHELIEQREKQLGATKAERDYGSDKTGAHSKGLAAELGFLGAVIESEVVSGVTKHADGTIDATRTVVFKYPDGTRHEVVVTVVKNNITTVARKKLP